MLLPRRPARRGTIAPMAALGLTVILAFVALAIDGGMLLDRRRQLQAAADAASLAGAAELYANYRPADTAPTSGSVASAVAAARAVGTLNGYTDGAANAVVTVNCPPQSGEVAARADKANFIEVVVTFNHPRYFSSVFGATRVPVAARSVAIGRRSQIKNAIITLDPTAPQSLEANGGGAFLVKGSPVQVNSSSPEAMVTNGGTVLGADRFNVTGVPGFSTVGGGAFVGTIIPSSPPIPDPLRFLPEPNPAELVDRSPNKQPTKITGGVKTLEPGYYFGGIEIGGQARVTMKPGIYYMDGGGFTLTAGASLDAQGVMIFNAPRSTSDDISIAGGGKVTMTPPTSGLYQGILLFQQRSSDVEVAVSGSGQFTMSGTFYAANAEVKVTGGGAADVIGAQYISRTLTINGGAGGSVSWNPNDTPGTRDLQLIE